MDNNTVNEIWFNYFNQYLFDKGVITETERNKMINLIKRKCHSPKQVANDNCKT